MKPKESSEIRWKNLRDSFDKVISLDEEERKNYLSELRFNEKTIYQELKELVAVQESAASFLEEPVLSFDTNSESESYIEESFGSYKIVREIGRGGMGAVFEAVRDDGEYEQRVAIKVTNRGLFNDELIKRFRNERQILAQLEHPNIVKLLDGGVTPQNIPFFIMEFIEGTPITQYCKERKLDADQVLNLFLDVCDAVSYAHSRLVVHRDLKPSNILVTNDGQVKLLDFGIAKIVDADAIDQTATQNAPLTPAYSSPEQIRGEIITTASDIFSLGILFYELVSGKTPTEFFGVSKTGMQRAICEQDVAKPSQNSARQAVLLQWSRQKRTDVDVIAQKAMMKEAVERYGSVERLAEDVRFLLDGMPIRARPQSFSYQASKFIKRNKVLVLVSSVAIFFTLFGASVAIWQSLVAREQKEIAEARFKQVRKIANSLILEYHDEIAKLDGSIKLRETIVADALEYLEAISKEGSENPELLTELGIAYRKIANVQGQSYSENLGKFTEAKTNYVKSVGFLRKAVALTPNDIKIQEELIESYRNLAIIHNRTNEKSPARSSIDSAIQLSGSLLKKNIDPRKHTMAHLFLLQTRADLESEVIPKIKLHKQSLMIAQQASVRWPDDLGFLDMNSMLNQRIGSTSNWRGQELEKEGSAQEAFKFYEESLKHHLGSRRNQDDIARISGSRNKLRTFLVHRDIAAVLTLMDQNNEALDEITSAEEIMVQLRTANPENKELVLDEIVTLIVKIDIYLNLGKIDIAEGIAKKGLDLAIHKYDSDTSDVESISWVGKLSEDLVKIMKAKKQSSQALHYSKLYDEYRTKFQKRFGRDWTFNY